MSAVEPFACIQQLSAGYFASRCLHAVADLGIADALDKSGMNVSDLAKATGSDPDALFRMLRLLDTHGVFRLDERFVTHTPASLLLRSDDPNSMRDFTRMFGLSVNWQSAEHLALSLKTGKASAESLFDGGFWGRLGAHPNEARIFGYAMIAKARAQIGAILESYDFSEFKHVVDVGGGQGHLLRAILRSCPNTTGTLFDLPHVIEAARTDGDEGGRMTFQGGDFFTDSIPTADAYILMEVVHDWADGPASQILRAVRDSASKTAKLLLIETEVPASRGPDWSKTLDIVMLILFAGKQRTAAEYQKLLGPQGFNISNSFDTGAGITVFEAT